MPPVELHGRGLVFVYTGVRACFVDEEHGGYGGEHIAGDDEPSLSINMVHHKDTGLAPTHVQQALLQKVCLTALHQMHKG